MSKCDLIGKVFGRLTVIRENGERQGGSQIWECKCSCGNTTTASTRKLNSKEKKSCGCLVYAPRLNPHKTHGESRSRLYRIYYHMKNRCYLATDKAFEYYGARGIKVCNEWIGSYENFSSWAKSFGYEEHLTLDRINPNGNYCPDNCRWVTHKKQANNRRNNVVLVVNGETMTLAECCQRYGLRYDYYNKKHNKGVDIECEIKKTINCVI